MILSYCIIRSNKNKSQITFAESQLQFHTRIIFGIALLLTLIGLSGTLSYKILSNNHEASHTNSLRQITIFLRHGFRTPSYSYNTDPYKDHNWIEGPGSLTYIGKIQLYELGKRFRKQYYDFIPKIFHQSHIFVRSSNKSRCLISAQKFLEGLLPSEQRSRKIPIHSVPFHQDTIVAGTRQCNLRQAMFEELLAKTNSDSEFLDLFDYVSEHTKQDMRSILKLNYLYCTLMSQQSATLKLPTWTEKVFPHMMRKPFALAAALQSFNESLQRLKVGPLLGEVKQNLDDAALQKNSDRILYIYSLHDTNIVSLWRALGHSELLEPEYGASMVLELHQAEMNFFVKVFYRNNSATEVSLQLRLPFCGEPCAYAQFAKHLDTLIPTNWDTECEKTKTSL